MIRDLFSVFMIVAFFGLNVQAQTTLKAAAEAAGLNIGIATNSNQVTSATSAYSTEVKTQFNIVVCENEMKFQSTEGTIGRFSYGGGEGVSKFAKANSMKMRGHTFIWHSQSNSAQSAVTNRTNGLSIMKTHIDSVGGYFKEKIHEWDVLNEITADGAGLRGTFWRTAIGDDYADSALSFSRKVIGTNGHLYYNDYGGDGVNNKSTSMFNLAKKWIQNKVPIDGIGLQCHLSSGFKKDDISANIKRFGDLGLRISLTEIDIKNAKVQDWTNLMDACLENFNCVSFVTWGLSDDRSWIGSNCGCLLYSGTATPKADMIKAVTDALAKADPTIAAKRKTFSALPPGSLGTVALRYYQSDLATQRRASNGWINGAAVPVFSLESGSRVDPLGRTRITPVADMKNVSILPQ